MTWDLSKPISAAMLADAGACPDAVEWVRKTHGTKPLRLTRDRLIEAAKVVDVDWLARFLPYKERVAYRKDIDKAWAAFEEATADARAAYREADAKARAALNKAAAEARAAYEEANDKAWAAYREAIAPAMAAEREAIAHALADTLRLP